MIGQGGIYSAGSRGIVGEAITIGEGLSIGSCDAISCVLVTGISLEPSYSSGVPSLWQGSRKLATGKSYCSMQPITNRAPYTMRTSSTPSSIPNTTSSPTTPSSLNTTPSRTLAFTLV
ncbi:hypothetical protein Tco_0937951 [Tanacetum coccineum]|uniref:Uncharacterized protein n=1 Tax=Tanacetum coccineum TaxID=301880 RepID=A0ABQ5DIH8_9ASTR